MMNVGPMGMRVNHGRMLVIVIMGCMGMGAGMIMAVMEIGMVVIVLMA